MKPKATSPTLLSLVLLALVSFAHGQASLTSEFDTTDGKLELYYIVSSNIYETARGNPCVTYHRSLSSPDGHRGG